MTANNTRNASELENHTAPETDQPYEPELLAVYIQFAAILTLVVVTVTGNLLLLAIVFRSAQLRATVSNALIVNLAVADSLIGVFVLPAFAATVLQGGPTPAEAVAPGLCSSAETTHRGAASGHLVCVPGAVIASSKMTKPSPPSLLLGIADRQGTEGQCPLGPAPALIVSRDLFTSADHQGTDGQYPRAPAETHTRHHCFSGYLEVDD